MLESRFWLRVSSFSGSKFPHCDLSIVDNFIFTHFLNEKMIMTLVLKMAKNE
jgi:hypothetical protein